MIRRISIVSFAIASAVLQPGAAAFAKDEGASAPVVTAHAETTLLADKMAVAPGETVTLALSQRLEAGWHVYWKNPGDSGLPLDLKWRLPEGFSAGEVDYPIPERIMIGPLANFGHKGAPTFLAPLAIPATAKPGEIATVGLKATWLICEEICVPEEGAFELLLRIADRSEPNARGAAAVAVAREAMPGPAAPGATFRAGADGLVLEVAAPKAAFDTAFFFPDTEGLVEPAAAQATTIDAGRLTIRMKPGHAYDPKFPENLKGVVVFETGGARTGFKVAAARDKSQRDGGSMLAPPLRGATAPQDGLPGYLLAALLGGILLNVMPCVFPILFIKAAALTKGAGASAGAIRRDGALYVLGVVATFAALGGLLLALRAGGAALGWGFHLQSPAVVLFSAYVLFLVGLNLAGVFHVGTSLQGVGSGLAVKGDALGAFMTGALAVFVAAPCLGPLLSAPMGAAVMLPPASGMAIFLALALGFAAPFAAFSFFPALGRHLPKPGPWTDLFKQTLSFPVFAGAAFFLWVLTEQTGTAGLARALAGAIVLGFAAFLFEKSKGEGGRRAVARLAAGALAIGAVATTINVKLVETATAKARKYGRLDALAYDAAAIETLRGEGRGVFVDFTAAWCVTCQVNKMTVLSSRTLAEAFAAGDVALMTADWTRRDPEITAALARFGANGVPLYVYYPPQGEARVLPQPLTERAVIDAIAGGVS